MICTLEVKSPPRCRMCIRHLCLFSAKGCVWIAFTEYLRDETWRSIRKFLEDRKLAQAKHLFYTVGWVREFLAFADHSPKDTFDNL